MPNFSSLARLEVPEKFLGVGGVGWCLHSHSIAKPNLVLRLGWGFDNIAATACLNFAYGRYFLSILNIPLLLDRSLRSPGCSPYKWPFQVKVSLTKNFFTSCGFACFSFNHPVLSSTRMLR